MKCRPSQIFLHKEMTLTLRVAIFACLAGILACNGAAIPNAIVDDQIPAPWSVEKAWQWYNSTPWLTGTNFIPSTASNQLEMWQPATYDPVTIERELGFLAKLKMNTVRVFLHNLPWYYSDATPSADASEQFLQRIDNFLSIAAKFNVKPLFVFFDDCWNGTSAPGPQLPPIPHVHNSRWVKSPSLVDLQNSSTYDALLQPYVLGVLNRFAQDSRILGWDLYNEVSNGQNALALLTKAFTWARQVKLSQPITSGLFSGRWDGQGDDVQSQINRLIEQNSDIITFHNYSPLDSYKGGVEALQKFGRPIVCTEYMARPFGSTFQAIMPYAKDNKIGSINWGFVNGKTQTIYPWDSWSKHYDGPPKVWFHDILQPDGTPFDQSEVDLILKLRE